jgi:hypothetical protein
MAKQVDPEFQAEMHKRPENPEAGYYCAQSQQKDP